MSVERNEEFDYFINDTMPVYMIGEMTFYPADILAECDPIAYRCAVADFLDFAENA
jgi:hypothetical protein